MDIIPGDVTSTIELISGQNFGTIDSQRDRDFWSFTAEAGLAYGIYGSGDGTIQQENSLRVCPERSYWIA